MDFLSHNIIVTHQLQASFIPCLNIFVLFYLPASATWNFMIRFLWDFHWSLYLFIYILHVRVKFSHNPFNIIIYKYNKCSCFTTHTHTHAHTPRAKDKVTYSSLFLRYTLFYVFVWFLGLSVKEYFPSLSPQPTTRVLYTRWKMKCFQQGKRTVYFEITPFAWNVLTSSQTYQQKAHQAFGIL